MREDGAARRRSRSSLGLLSGTCSATSWARRWFSAMRRAREACFDRDPGGSDAERCAASAKLTSAAARIERAGHGAAPPRACATAADVRRGGGRCAAGARRRRAARGGARAPPAGRPWRGSGGPWTRRRAAADSRGRRGVRGAVPGGPGDQQPDLGGACGGVPRPPHAEDPLPRALAALLPRRRGGRAKKDPPRRTTVARLGQLRAEYKNQIRRTA